MLGEYDCRNARGSRANHNLTLNPSPVWRGTCHVEQCETSLRFFVSLRMTATCHVEQSETSLLKTCLWLENTYNTTLFLEFETMETRLTTDSQQSILIFLGKSRKSLIKFNIFCSFYYLCGTSLFVRRFRNVSTSRTTKWRKNEAIFRGF